MGTAKIDKHGPMRDDHKPVREGDCPDDQDITRERPNPCRPPREQSDPCGCKPPPSITPKPERPKCRPKPRPTDCCDQLLELLGGKIGPDGKRRVFKPKQRPERKVQALCDSLGVADAIIPLLAVLWERFRQGEGPRNQYELKIIEIFKSISPKDAEAFSYAWEQYKKMRGAGKVECLFNDCLAEAAREGPVERSWVAEEILREGFKVAGQLLFDKSGGIAGPGQVRLWDNDVFHGPNGSGATVYQGPWPWLTSIGPDHSSSEEYGNVQSFRPQPGGSHVWQNYQYAQNCTFSTEPTQGPGAKVVAHCSRVHPAPPAPGSLVPNSCEGGPDYTHNNDCLRIPAQKPGGSLKLRGFNFITPAVTVRIQRVGDPSVWQDVVCTVWGDKETPVNDASNHSIVDERVWDWVDCPLPSGHPQQPGPLPAGLYEIFVKVPNVTNAMYDGSIPPVLESNRLLLRIEADPNLSYLVWSNWGRCNRETAGLGDDEIWWDAFTGHMVPTEVPVPATSATGPAPLTLKGLERRSFPRPPWEDMDDATNAGAYSIDIWGPKPFELYGVAVMAIVGFEVDSESAARDYLQGFWNAWGHALESVFKETLAGTGTATGLAELAYEAGLIAAKTALTVAVIAIVVIIALVLISTFFWALWAPADLIALDVMHFDAQTAWNWTDPGVPLPPFAVRRFGDPEDEDNIVTVTQVARDRDHKPGDAAATWLMHVRYDTPEDGEDASYTLQFLMART